MKGSERGDFGEEENGEVVDQTGSDVEGEGRRKQKR